MLNFIRHLFKLRHNLLDFVAIHCAFYLCQIKTEHVCCNDLCHKSFSRSNSDFWTSMRVKHSIGFARNARALRIAYCKNPTSLLARVTQSHKSVHCFARLRYCNHQCSMRQNRVAVAKLVRKLHLNRHAHPVLNRIFCNQTCVTCRAASNNNNFVNRAQHVLANMNFVKNNISLSVKTPAQSVCNSVWIFMNFLIHKGIPAAFFYSRRIPVNCKTRRIFNNFAVKISKKQTSFAAFVNISNANSFILANF